MNDFPLLRLKSLAVFQGHDTKSDALNFVRSRVSHTPVLTHSCPLFRHTCSGLSIDVGKPDSVTCYALSSLSELQPLKSQNSTSRTQSNLNDQRSACRVNTIQDGALFPVIELGCCISRTDSGLRSRQYGSLLHLRRPLWLLIKRH